MGVVVRRSPCFVWCSDVLLVSGLVDLVAAGDRHDQARTKPPTTGLHCGAGEVARRRWSQPGVDEHAVFDQAVDEALGAAGTSGWSAAGEAPCGWRIGRLSTVE